MAKEAGKTTTSSGPSVWSQALQYGSQWALNVARQSQQPVSVPIIGQQPASVPIIPRWVIYAGIGLVAILIFKKR